MDFEDIDEQAFRNMAHEFQGKVIKALMFASLFQKESQKQMNREKLETVVKNLNLYSATLVR